MLLLSYKWKGEILVGLATAGMWYLFHVPDKSETEVSDIRLDIQQICQGE